MLAPPAPSAASAQGEPPLPAVQELLSAPPVLNLQRALEVSHTHATTCRGFTALRRLEAAEADAGAGRTVRRWHPGDGQFYGSRKAVMLCSSL